MIEFTIADEIAAAGVSVTLGCIECAVSVTEGDADLNEALSREAARWAADLAGTPVAEVPQVAAARRAYKALGKDPSRYRPSAEALLRRLVQGKDLYRINTVVDTNNLISLRTGLSIGAYDASALEPPLDLRKGRADEPYEAIGRGPLNIENLPVLADASGPFGSPTSDSARTMITAETQNLLMVLFGFGDVPDLEPSLKFAGRCLEAYCAARDLASHMVSTA